MIRRAGPFRYSVTAFSGRFPWCSPAASVSCCCPERGSQSHRALPSPFAGILHQSLRTCLVGLGGLNKHCLWVTSRFTMEGFVFLSWPAVPHAVGWRKSSLRYLAQQSLPCYQSHLSWYTFLKPLWVQIIQVLNNLLILIRDKHNFKK